MARNQHVLAVIDGGRSGRRPRPGGRRRARRLSRRSGLFALILAALAIAPLSDADHRPVERVDRADRVDRAEKVPAPRCRILSVTDGDTLNIHCPARGTERARLPGFDTPELFSPRCASEYRAALRGRQALSRMIRAADDISVVREGRDRYGRGLFGLYLDGEPASRTMIDAGHARPYDRGSRRGWCG